MTPNERDVAAAMQGAESGAHAIVKRMGLALQRPQHDRFDLIDPNTGEVLLRSVTLNALLSDLHRRQHHKGPRKA